MSGVSVRNLVFLAGWLVTGMAVASLSVLALGSITIRILQRRSDAEDAKASSQSQKDARGFIIPARVYHARFLPKESAHAFRYPALYLTVELSALEKSTNPQNGKVSRRGLDIPRLLKLRDASSASQPWTVSNIDPKEYYRSEYIGIKDPDLRHRVEGSIRLKTLFELRDRGLIQRGPQDVTTQEATGPDAFKLDNEIGQIWSITIPSLLGFQGINPLTTYFCYEPRSDGSRGQLKYVLLEVHNTFTERHLYVLECGVDEDPVDARALGAQGGIKQLRRSDCDHQWTFPRTFHVSPFNDRGGYYTCSVKDLVDSSASRPTLDIRVTLLIPDPKLASDTKRATDVPLVKKMVAVLTSHPESTADKLNPLRPVELNANNLLLAFLRQPLDLFLTFARIAYEAARLHYGKNRLDVFGKPEMDDRVGMQPLVEYDGIGWPPSLNPTEFNRHSDSSDVTSTEAARAKSGALERSAASSTDLFAHRLLNQALHASNESSSLSIQVDGALQLEITSQDKPGLTIYARSAAVYSDLLLYPAYFAHAAGSRISRRWGVSDVSAYARVFTALQSASHSLQQDSKASTLAIRMARSLRASHFKWAIKVVPTSCDPDLLPKVRAVEGRLQASAHEPHLFDTVSAAEQWAVVRHLLTALLIARAEEAVFRLVGARYVRGLEPWSEVRRAIDLLAQEAASDHAHEKDSNVSKPAWFYLGSSRRPA
ncbi:hypothetical protein OC846_001656 [Tilletia horrida]|uniref:Uncharacterized protein n=1 Tax=Tilletia horrida TaxID=155126 RepID=A0AAN6GSB6_9BASI|nr:hypothetical protein OC845_002915 [Tilletia horrida]KAK0555496.1 hypothetical protein OC846_001656 [Tilletia horrida]